MELSEGDLVLTFNKSIDLMRQIREMLLDVKPDHVLVEQLRAAERMLRHGIVEQALTLGYNPIELPEMEQDPDSEPEPELEAISER